MGRGNGFDPEGVMTGGGTAGQAFSFGKQVLRAGGITGLMSLILSLFIAFLLWTSVRDIQRTMATAETKMGAFAATQSDFDRRREDQLAIQLLILRRLCANSAKDAASQEACWK